MDCGFVLRGKFLRIRNRSVYEPQEKNPEGEVHEDWDFISYDQDRETFILREFHVEGFVNQYILDTVSEDGRTMTFLTESLENVPKGWRGRERFCPPPSRGGSGGLSSRWSSRWQRRT